MSVPWGSEGESPIIQYWHGGDVPAEIEEMIATFEERNPELRHLVFDEAEAESLIAEFFAARELAAFRACAVPAMQADFFRYCAVLALGGIYCDVDFHCQRPLRPLIEDAGAGLLFENRLGNIENSVFVFEASGHPLLRLAVDIATENILRRASDKVHMVTGPWVMGCLRGVHRRGSLDIAREEASGGPIESLVHSVLEAIGSYKRVSEAFEDVRIDPLARALEWVAKPQERPRYKQTPSHWQNWHESGKSIFR